MATTDRREASPSGLPHLALSRYLSEAEVLAAAREAGWRGRLRKLGPWLSVWGLVAQALWSNASQHRVGTLLAAATGMDLSAGSGAYCRARRRVPVKLLMGLAWRLATVSRAMVQLGGRRWLLDGGCLALLDSAANQAVFPQSVRQKAGCGFPLLHFVALVDLDTGAVVAVAVGSLGEHDARLARPLWDWLAPGDTVIADRGFASWGFLAAMERREVWYVVRQHQRRKNEQPLVGERDDRRESWPRPKEHPEWWDAELPEKLTVRVVRQRLSADKVVTVNTNLPEATAAVEVLALYEARWQVETRFLEFKVLLATEPVRAKDPDTAQVVFWGWVLAYNLICCLLCETAVEHQVPRYQLSFTAALDALAAAPLLADRTPEKCGKWVREQINAFRLPHRGDGRRDEPRVVKSRHRAYTKMTKPRGDYPQRGRSRAA